MDYKKYLDIFQQQYNAYPPDGTEEQLKCRIDVTFRESYAEALKDANIYYVNEYEKTGLWLLAKIMFNAGRIFETNDIELME